MSEIAIPSPSPEQRRVAAGQFDRASQVVAEGNFDYGIKLLLNCCKLDPGNLIYRKALRHAQQSKYENNGTGSRLAALSTAPAKLRLKKALHQKNVLAIFEACEAIFGSNPWDTQTHVAMGQTFIQANHLTGAVWCLQQARQKDPDNIKINRLLAKLLEKNGLYTEANALWALIRKKDPADQEAQDKIKELAAHQTIVKGKYLESLQNEEPTAVHQAFVETEETEHLPGPSKDKFASMRKRIEADPGNPGLYLELASALAREQRWDDAAELLVAGLQATGNHFELAVALADLHIQPLRENLRVVESRLAKNAQDEELQKIRIDLLSKINRLELDIHRQKSDRYPMEASHRLEMSICLLKAGQIDSAIQELQSLRADQRVRWKALMYLGFCFKERKNWRLAERNFSEALESMPAGELASKKEILFQLATGSAQHGNHAKAIEWGYELANEDFMYKQIGELLDQWQVAVETPVSE